VERYYTERSIKKGDKVRRLWIPNPELMDVLRRIQRKVLSPIVLPESVHGAVRGRSPKSNAEIHLSSRCIVKVDARKFFDKVRHGAVYRMFRHDLGFGCDVARLLTRLTTRDARLPQGTPTSPSIANLVLVPIDGTLAKKASAAGIQCTRFVDDVTLSGDDPRHLINEVAKLLSTRRLPIHRRGAMGKPSKLQILPRTFPQEVTGLLVNGSSRATLSKARRDKIRAAIHQLPDDGVTKKELRKINGRIAHAKRFNSGSAARLERQLKSRQKT